MARGPCAFRQQDVTRAIRAAFAAGAVRAQIVVGGITITAEKSAAEEGSLGAVGANEWDAPPVEKQNQ
jgi:hypothetical protein